MASTRMSKFIAAPRERVYDALLDPEAVARWKVPAGMRCHVHEFNASEGGAIRIARCRCQQCQHLHKPPAELGTW